MRKNEMGQYFDQQLDSVFKKRILLAISSITISLEHRKNNNSDCEELEVCTCTCTRF